MKGAVRHCGETLLSCSLVLGCFYTLFNFECLSNTAHQEYIDRTHVLISSIKREVKKKHLPSRRSFSCFPAHLIERDLLRTAAPWTRVLGSTTQRFGFSLLAVFIVCSRRSQSSSETSKAERVVRCQPWFYRRLVAYSFFGLSERA